MWKAVNQWPFQDPTDGGTLVPFFRPYFMGIFPYIGLKNRPFYGRYLQSIGSWHGHWNCAMFLCRKFPGSHRHYAQVVPSTGRQYSQDGRLHLVSFAPTGWVKNKNKALRDHWVNSLAPNPFSTHDFWWFNQKKPPTFSGYTLVLAKKNNTT